MKGLPGPPVTDENGVYSVEVKHGWNGTVTPVKLGYTFVPSERIYQPVKENKTTEDYVGTLLKYTIAGSVGMPGVAMQGLPGNPVTGQDGRYTVTVPYGFNSVVQPAKTGYRFEPASKMYESLTEDKANENYKGLVLTYPISGSVGVDGVTMKGLPGNVVSSGGGLYRAEVPYGWDGTVIPEKEGHEFLPEERQYPEMTNPQTDQDYTPRVYTYQVSGSVSVPGVTLQGLPDCISDSSGFYSATVEYGWKGKVTPFKPGYSFTPPNMNFTKVTTDLENRNFNAALMQMTISGNVGAAAAGAVMEGLPGNVIVDPTGFYTAKVEYGWSGTVAPVKDGFTFNPSNMVLPPIEKDMANTNFKASPIMYTISGNVGLKGVIMDGLPMRPISGADGSYTAQVPYKFTGTVTPRIPGYTFDPPKRDYAALTEARMSEMYTYSIVQHVISGRVLTETGPVAGVAIQASNEGGATTTDANGQYQLPVNHGWNGQITALRQGYTFSPAVKTIQSVMAAVSNVGFVGKVQMFTITDSVVFEDGPTVEPIQDVIITAEPGGARAVTDAKGKFSIKVPYGWTGELMLEKEGIEFDPPSLPYSNVIQDIDKTAPPAPVPPVTQPVTEPVTPSVTQPVTPPVTPAPTPATPPVETSTMSATEARRQQLLEELRKINEGGAIDPTPFQPTPTPTPTPTPAPVVPGPLDSLALPRNGQQMGLRLLDALALLQKQTGVKIAVDATVKSDPVPIRFELTTVTAGMVSQALQSILEPTEYMFQKEGDAYLVFKPISNTFLGDDLAGVLQDISLDAGVTIISDPNVAGMVYANLEDVPLDEALNQVLAGSPFNVKRAKDYYLVADRSPSSPGFYEISDTHHVRLNYKTPKMVSDLLSPAFKNYVRTDTDPNSRMVSVIAPESLANRIISDIKALDTKPRHVVLEARVVVMERDDMLDLGVEWGWPKIRAGSFKGDVGSLWGAGIGMGADATFTDSLLLALNLLEENSEAHILTKPVVTAQDGKMADLSVTKEEYYMLTANSGNSELNVYSMTEMVTIVSGTKLQITPYIGDNNDITLEIAAEVSESVAAVADTGLPVVTRRTSRNVTTIEDGGTVALAGLSETRTKSTEKKVPGLSGLPLVGGLFQNTDNEEITMEVAVFVTASLMHETPIRSAQEPAAYQPSPALPTGTPAGGGNPLRDELANRMAAESMMR